MVFIEIRDTTNSFKWGWVLTWCISFSHMMQFAPPCVAHFVIMAHEFVDFRSLWYYKIPKSSYNKLLLAEIPKCSPRLGLCLKCFLCIRMPWILLSEAKVLLEFKVRQNNGFRI